MKKCPHNWDLRRTRLGARVNCTLCDTIKSTKASYDFLMKTKAKRITRISLVKKKVCELMSIKKKVRANDGY